MIVLPGHLRDEIVDRSLESPNVEICGIMAGEFSRSRSTVSAIFPTRNVSSNPTNSFQIDPAEQLSVFETIEANGLDIVGFYHSHPHGSPDPSDRDRRDAAWPHYSYLIIGTNDPPRIRSWRWNESTGDFESELVIISRRSHSDAPAGRVDQDDPTAQDES